jgi:nucleoside-diphosphate-sugar epimerase
MSANVNLVLGASGFIGTRLVRSLAEASQAVRAVDLLPPRKTLPGVEYHTLDVRNPLPSALGEGVSRIYNLAAIHRTPGHPDHEYYDTNLAGALNATALASQASVNEMLFTSSISVYGPSEDLMTEDSELKPVSAYGKSKRLAEEIHRRWRAEAPDRRLVIVRPGVVFGPGERGNYTNLARAMQRRMFAYPGRRTVVKSGGYVDDLLGAIQFAFAQSDPYVLFNFAYPDESSLEDIVTAFAKIIGGKASYPTAPLSAMMSAALVFEMLNAVGVRNPIHRERILKLVNSTKIAPGWLTSRGYPFKMNLQTSLESWGRETSGAFD